MRHKILVPHDGYEMSDKALNYAIEIAKAMDMEITVLRVLPEIIEGSSLFLSEKERERVKRELSRVSKEVQKKVYDSLEKQVNVCESKGVRASRMVLVGEPVEKILSVANKEDPFLIIIGSRRLKGLGKLKVLGSVARKVSEQAKCPVTIVH
ncbi:MAG: universal stress protein [Nitrososphaerales archaeon]